MKLHQGFDSTRSPRAWLSLFSKRRVLFPPHLRRPACRCDRDLRLVGALGIESERRAGRSSICRANICRGSWKFPQRRLWETSGGTFGGGGLNSFGRGTFITLLTLTENSPSHFWFMARCPALAHSSPRPSGRTSVPAHSSRQSRRWPCDPFAAPALSSAANHVIQSLPVLALMAASVMVALVLDLLAADLRHAIISIADQFREARRGTL